MSMPTCQEIINAIRLSCSESCYDFFFLNDFEDHYNHLVKLGFDTDLKWAHLLGQLRHESGGFAFFMENLNYSEKAVMRVWPKRFKTRAAARKVARNPQALANAVYNGRMGNRMGTDDGWNFRGRGLIQLTGRNNYLNITRKFGLDFLSDPDRLARQAKSMWWAAGDFFATRKRGGKTLIEIAGANDVRNLTRAINGGYHGLEDRKAWTEFYISVFRNTSKLGCTSLVKRGSRGKFTKNVQHMLFKLGYLTKPYQVDGKYGPSTEEAIKQFQKWANLKQDGIVGSNTYVTLFVRYDEAMDIEQNF
ncbi:glycohydrolase [Vibrio phage C-ZP2022]|nr:glycohydrolase [Vibrio phage C-ZP2022]